MFCQKCGQEIEQVKICPKCGCLSGYTPPSVKVQKDYTKAIRVISIIAAVLYLVSIIINILRGGTISIFTIAVLSTTVLLLFNCNRKLLAIPFGVLVILNISWLISRFYFIYIVEIVLFAVLLANSLKPSKALGIISIVIAAISIPLLSVVMLDGWIFCTSMLLISIALFLRTNSDKANSGKKSEL